MRVGVYIDGFNLYYGARALCGRSKPGWRWLDLRSLTAAVVGPRWPGWTFENIVYCTAAIDAATNPSGHADQDVYMKAVLAAGSIDKIEKGTYVAGVKEAPLATRDAKGRPILWTSDWPLMVRTAKD